MLQHLSRLKTLLVSGDADEVVEPQRTTKLFEVMRPVAPVRHLSLEGGTHDLFGHKALLRGFSEVFQWAFAWFLLVLNGFKIF